MKKTNFKINKTKLIARMMLIVLLLTSAVNFTACRNKGLEAGFKWRQHPDGTSDYFCAYKSDKREFDINDVTLIFYYGCTKGITCPSFKLYFENKNGDIYLIKEVRDPNPDDYKVNLEYKETLFFNTYEKVFNYSESITIPKELFVNDSGVILFNVAITWSIDDLINESEWDNITRAAIYYKVKDNTVILSEKSFDK